MKKLALLSLGLYVFVQLSSQDTVKTNNQWGIDKNDRFNEVNCPIGDGYSIWFMRQNLSCNSFQTILETTNVYNNHLESNTPEYRLETYIPIIKSKKFNTIIGSRYWRSSLLQENNEIDNITQFIWIWTTLQYQPTEKWNLMLSSETYQSGNKKSFDEKLSNQFFVVGYAGYSMFDNWQIIGLFRYDMLWKPDGLKRSIIPGVQVKWLPQKNLKLMTGMPVIFATEWTPFEKLDLAAYCWYNMKNNAFIRYRITDKISISTIYKASNFKSSDIFGDTKTTTIENQTFSYDNMTQTQHRLALEIGCRFTPNTSIQLTLGRLLYANTKYNLNDNEQRQSTSLKGWYVGASIYFLNF
jgi:hypothetical protein